MVAKMQHTKLQLLCSSGAQSPGTIYIKTQKSVPGLQLEVVMRKPEASNSSWWKELKLNQILWS